MIRASACRAHASWRRRLDGSDDVERESFSEVVGADQSVKGAANSWKPARVVQQAFWAAAALVIGAMLAARWMTSARAPQ